MSLLKTLVVFGTRPEAIKLAPFIKEMGQNPAFELKICVTAQHRQMLDQVLDFFEIVPDWDLNLMESGQSLTDLTVRILQSLKNVLSEYRPDLVVVHGDTTTAFAAALGAFYQQIPIAHIEAGLRTHTRYSPFPEEANRRLTAVLAKWHFAPTETAKQNLCREGVDTDCIWVTGNTVIDALFQTLQKIRQNPPLAAQLAAHYPFLDRAKKRLLVTVHRRENLGSIFEQICLALERLAQRDDLQIIYPLHLNPQIQRMAHQRLGQLPNLFLIAPQAYLPFTYLMSESDLILTDSGGIQEEAPALGKPVLVMREVSERLDAIESGLVKLIGTDSRQIVREVEQCLAQPLTPTNLPTSPYGDGNAAKRISHILTQQMV